MKLAAEDKASEEIRDTNPVLQEMREGLPSRLKGICGECMMRGTCLGSCVAMSYYRHRDSSRAVLVL